MIMNPNYPGTQIYLSSNHTAQPVESTKSGAFLGIFLVALGALVFII